MKLAFILSFLLAATARAHPGVGIVQDSRGNVFFTDLKQVWKIASDGKRTIAVEKVHTHELCLDLDDALYGEHLWYEGDATKKWGHRVWCLRRDGTLVDVIPARAGFLGDYSFVRDRAGNMYWADHGENGQRTVIKKRSPSGKIATHAAADFRDVNWMIAKRDGTLFLIDAGDLRRVAPDGKVTTIATKLSEHKPPPANVSNRHYHQGIWTDSNGDVYVAVTEERLVLKVEADGKSTVAARSGDNPETRSKDVDRIVQGAGDLVVESWSPTGGMFDRDGNLWLLEYSSRHAVRARRIDHNAKELVFQPAQ